MLKKILCIAAALCGLTGLAHGALTYTQTQALFLGSIYTYIPPMGGLNYLRVATNGTGVSVFAWSAPAVKENNIMQGWANGIFFQRCDTNGNPLGSLMRIDPTFRSCETCPLSSLSNPIVAIDNLSRYIIAWVDQTTPSGPSFGNSVLKGRLYDEHGSLIKEAELLQPSDFNGSNIDLRLDANGNFIVVYSRGFFVNGNTQYDIFARRFNAQGAPVGAEITVSNNPATDNNSTLAVNRNGAFAVTWQRARTADCVDSQYSKPGQCDDILLRRFNNQGVPLGGETKVANGNNNMDQTPSIAMDNQGNFVVAWDRYRDLCQNMLQCDDILAQRYSAAGAKLGAAIPVIANNNQNDIGPQVAMDGNGKFVVMWQRASVISGTTVLSPADVLFRSYDANGLNLGGTVSYRIASGLSTSQFDNVYPRVGISDTGKLNVLWGTDINVPSPYSSSNKVLVFRQMIPSAW